MKKTKEKVDVAEAIGKLQNEITVLAGKIDILISKLASAPVAQGSQKPVSQPVRQLRPLNSPVNTHNNTQNNGRIMFKAICADCKKECEVPFKPREERPVYCKECFSKRRAVNSFKIAPDAKPKESVPVQAVPASKPEPSPEKKAPVKKKISAPKKKPAPKRRKAGK